MARRTRIDVDALYDSLGSYSYVRGWKPAAMIAVNVPAPINLPGLLASAAPRLFGSVGPLWTGIYNCAGFVGVDLL